MKDDFFKYQAQTTPHPLAMEISHAEGSYIYDSEGNAHLHGDGRCSCLVERAADCRRGRLGAASVDDWRGFGRGGCGGNRTDIAAQCHDRLDHVGVDLFLSPVGCGGRGDGDHRPTY